MNSGSSSYTQRSAEPAQLPIIIEEETEARRHGTDPDCSAPSPPECGSASTEQVHPGLHGAGKWAPGVFLGRPQRLHWLLGLMLGSLQHPCPLPRHRVTAEGPCPQQPTSGGDGEGCRRGLRSPLGLTPLRPGRPSRGEGTRPVLSRLGLPWHMSGSVPAVWPAREAKVASQRRR